MRAMLIGSPPCSELVPESYPRRPWVRLRGGVGSSLVHAVRRASVGDVRAARTAGYRPATPPMTTARPIPPTIPIHGSATSQPWLVAYAAETAEPSTTPASPPAPASSSASARN